MDRNVTFMSTVVAKIFINDFFSIGVKISLAIKMPTIIYALSAKITSELLSYSTLTPGISVNIGIVIALPHSCFLASACRCYLPSTLA